MTDKLLTKEQVADYYGVSERTIERWVISGLLPRPKRIGKRTVRWRSQDIFTTEADRTRQVGESGKVA